MVCGAGCLLVLLSSLFALHVGSTSINGWEMLMTVTGQTHDATLGVVVWELRIPRILLAGLTGACLSLAGVTLQSLLRNPLADPFIVGTSSGAALGAAIAIVLGFSAWLVPGCAFVGATLAVCGVISGLINELTS